MTIELTVMISNGFHSSLVALTPTIAQKFDVVLRILQGPSMGSKPHAIPKRLAHGEHTDLIVMVAEALNKLIADGHARGDTRREIAHSPIGMAVKRGAPVPDISTEDALRKTLLAASSIGYSDSASGCYVSETLFGRLGVEEVASKARKIEETPVADVVARGEVEIGFQEVSEIMPVAGALLIGRLPPELQKITPFAVAIATGSDHVPSALQVVEFLASSAVWPLIEAEGLMAPKSR